MVDRPLEVQTCAESLLHAGTCCAEGCDAAASAAVLEHDTLVEHARCENHLLFGGSGCSIKPLSWAEEWKP